MKGKREKEHAISDIMEFANREEFRKWLSDHCLSNAGVWLLFGEVGGPKTIKAKEALEERGLMTEFGREKIQEAKKNGQWYALKPAAVPEEQIAQLFAPLEGYESAYTNFSAMSLSVKKTYAKAYFDAKTDAGREKRMAWMIDRLNKNLKPM